MAGLRYLEMLDVDGQATFVACCTSHTRQWRRFHAELLGVRLSRIRARRRPRAVRP